MKYTFRNPPKSTEVIRIVEVITDPTMPEVVTYGLEYTLQPGEKVRITIDERHQWVVGEWK